MTTLSRARHVVTRPTVRRRIVLALWIVVAAVVALRLSVMFGQPIRPGESYRGFEGYFLDFRNTIWTPGRFLLDGGNPYDPDAYLAENPWELPFSLYAPAWLGLAVILAPLPYLASVAVFQVLSIGVAIVLLRVLCKWAMPTMADLAVPVGLLWLNIWYPGRGAISVQLGSLLGVLGALLVLRSLSAQRSRVDRAAVLGVALSLVKVQFGVVALFALAGGRFREAWRGVLGMVLASVPIVVVCSLAAGGPIPFVRSVLRDFKVLSSDLAPTGLSNPVQRRFDLLGELARWGLTHPPAWLQIAILVPALAAVVFVVRRTRDPLALSTVLVTAMLIGVYHNPYDLVLLIIPVVVGIGMAVRGELTRTVDRVMVAAMALVVVHLHTVTTAVIPGFDVHLADTLDLALVGVALGCGLYRAAGAGWMPESSAVGDTVDDPRGGGH